MIFKKINEIISFTFKDIINSSFLIKMKYNIMKGEAFSEKTLFKVDRIAAYHYRYVVKTIVAAGQAN